MAGTLPLTIPPPPQPPAFSSSRSPLEQEIFYAAALSYDRDFKESLDLGALAGAGSATSTTTTTTTAESLRLAGMKELYVAAAEMGALSLVLASTLGAGQRSHAVAAAAAAAARGGGGALLPPPPPKPGHTPQLQFESVTIATQPAPPTATLVGQAAKLAALRDVGASLLASADDLRASAASASAFLDQLRRVRAEGWTILGAEAANALAGGGGRAGAMELDGSSQGAGAGAGGAGGGGGGPGGGGGGGVGGGGVAGVEAAPRLLPRVPHVLCLPPSRLHSGSRSDAGHDDNTDLLAAAVRASRLPATRLLAPLLAGEMAERWLAVHGRRGAGAQHGRTTAPNPAGSTPRTSRGAAIALAPPPDHTDFRLYVLVEVGGAEGRACHVLERDSLLGEGKEAAAMDDEEDGEGKGASAEAAPKSTSAILSSCRRYAAAIAAEHAFLALASQARRLARERLSGEGMQRVKAAEEEAAAERLPATSSSSSTRKRPAAAPAAAPPAASAPPAAPSTPSWELVAVRVSATDVTVETRGVVVTVGVAQGRAAARLSSSSSSSVGRGQGQGRLEAAAQAAARLLSDRVGKGGPVGGRAAGQGLLLDEVVGEAVRVASAVG
jgi:hypothetical protein